MNEHFQKLAQLDFDRLVDGSLTGDDYCKLIQQLDTTPSGWRQCALTFLEQQALARDFGELMKEPPANVDLEPDSVAKGRAAGRAAGRADRSIAYQSGRRAQRSWSTKMLAVAASFLLAFGLGIVAQNILGGWGGQYVVDPVQPIPGTTVVSNPTLPVVVQDDSGQRRQFQVPVVNASRGNQDLGPAIGDKLPLEVDRMIQKMNIPYEVRRNMVSLTDKQGNVYYIPVDQIKFGKTLAHYQ